MADDTRVKLLDAAAEVFAERGYDGAGVAEIARRAGLTTGAIYSQYSGKAQLLVEAIDACVNDYFAAIFAATDHEPADVVLTALGTHLLDPERAGTSTLLLEATVAARREADLAEMLVHRLEHERSQLAKLIEEAKAAGAFDADVDTDAAITFCHALGLGFVFYRTLGLPMPDPPAWRTVISRVVAAAQPQKGTPNAL